MKAELIDIYNEKKQKTGRIVERKKGVILESWEYVISVTCWIVNLEGKILLTRRKLDKKNGGLWEPTTGLVISGEDSLQGISRELNEEIGLKIDNSKINLVKEIIEKRKDVNFIRDIYLIHDNISISEIKFNDGEVIDAKYVTLDEFVKMLENNETFKWLENFIEIYNKLIKM